MHKENIYVSEIGKEDKKNDMRECLQDTLSYMGQHTFMSSRSENVLKNDLNAQDMTLHWLSFIQTQLGYCSIIEKR